MIPGQNAVNPSMQASGSPSWRSASGQESFGAALRLCWDSCRESEQVGVSGGEGAFAGGYQSEGRGGGGGEQVAAALGGGFGFRGGGGGFDRVGQQVALHGDGTA